MRLFPTTIAAVFFASSFVSSGRIASAADKPVDYVTQIKPILVKHCYGCHAAKKQQSGLRVDTGALAIRGGDRGRSIVPGDSAKSLLYRVLAGIGDVTRMPAEKPPLSKRQIALIKRWIDEGAKSPKNEIARSSQAASTHWAFQPIRRPAVPSKTDWQSVLPHVKNATWVKNPIDRFVLARLKKAGLQPSRETNRTTLIRRLSLDLRGLPPGIWEINEFLNDSRPGAYERLVDRILASPRFGERWGRHWLDAARYADSNGFTIDGPRSIWKYRDWVIRAMNGDVPFDRFVTEQLAGDMLPVASTQQIIATGFHRNTLINQEGGHGQRTVSS